MEIGTRNATPAMEAPESTPTTVPRLLTNQRTRIAEATTWPVAAKPTAAMIP